MTVLELMKKAKKVKDETDIWNKIKGNSLGGFLEFYKKIKVSDGEWYYLYTDDLNEIVYAVPVG